MTPMGSGGAASAAAFRRQAVSWLQAGPLALTFLLFLVVPIGTIFIVSFFDYENGQLILDFTLDNYKVNLGSAVTWETYANTVRFAAIVWVLTLGIGFTVAYFLAFCTRSATVQTALFLLCTIPFLTSNIIRMISWIPLLGRNGLANSLLLQLHVIDHPLEWLLYSNFAVILAFVHLYTLFMCVPIFNCMVRIDRALIEAARDAGAGPLRILWDVVVPLSKPGIAIGSIFVVTLVMGDFVTVQLMSGGQSSSVGLMMKSEIDLLQYSDAATNAVVLLIIVLMMVMAMLRVVDIRKEL